MKGNNNLFQPNIDIEFRIETRDNFIVGTDVINFMWQMVFEEVKQD